MRQMEGTEENSTGQREKERDVMTGGERKSEREEQLDGG